MNAADPRELDGCEDLRDVGHVETREALHERQAFVREAEQAAYSSRLDNGWIMLLDENLRLQIGRATVEVQGDLSALLRALKWKREVHE